MSADCAPPLRRHQRRRLGQFPSYAAAHGGHQAPKVVRGACRIGRVFGLGVGRVCNHAWLPNDRRRPRCLLECRRTSPGRRQALPRSLRQQGSALLLHPIRRSWRSGMARTVSSRDRLGRGCVHGCIPSVMGDYARPDYQRCRATALSPCVDGAVLLRGVQRATRPHAAAPLRAARLPRLFASGGLCRRWDPSASVEPLPIRSRSGRCELGSEKEGTCNVLAERRCPVRDDGGSSRHVTGGARAARRISCVYRRAERERRVRRACVGDRSGDAGCGGAPTLRRGAHSGGRPGARLPRVGRRRSRSRVARPA